MVTVYRIEGPDGNGLFTSYSDKYGDKLIRKHSNWSVICNRHWGDEFPSPGRDEVLQGVDINDKLFAYNTKSKVSDAIVPSEMKECIDLGFKIYRLVIRENGCIQTPYQTVFHKVAVIKKEDITEQFI